MDHDLKPLILELLDNLRKVNQEKAIEILEGYSVTLYRKGVDRGIRDTVKAVEDLLRIETPYGPN